MSELTAREMRKGYGAITEALERDGEIILTRHGKPYARVVPYSDPDEAKSREAEEREQMRAWVEKRRKALAKMPMLPPFDWDEFRADR